MNQTWENQIDEQSDQALFDRISEKYCRKDLKWASRLARKLRLEQTVKPVLTGNDQKILDLGCGAGFSAEYLEGRFSEFLGVDYSEKLIDLAKRHVRVSNATFEAANIRDLDLADSFDGAFMIGVLHHLTQPDETVQSVVECLKPGGWLAVNEPSSHNYLINVARNVRKKLDKDFSDEQVSISNTELVTILERNGFTDVKTYAQGLFSTPFAEVVMPQVIAAPLSLIGVGFDKLIEAIGAGLLKPVSWNLIAVGRKPRGDSE